MHGPGGARCRPGWLGSQRAGRAFGRVASWRWGCPGLGGVAGRGGGCRGGAGVHVGPIVRRFAIPPAVQPRDPDHAGSDKKRGSSALSIASSYQTNSIEPLSGPAPCGERQGPAGP